MGYATRHHLELLVALIAKEFKVRYKNTTLGFLWSLANPIFFALVFYFAFKVILKVQVEGYFPFLLAGLFPWQWFANTVNTSPAVYIGNAGLIKKVYFPRLLLPMSMAGNHSIHFLMALLVAIPILAIYGSYPTLWWIPGIPSLLVVQFGIALGLSLALSSLNVFFRDLEHITTIATNIVFYLTPVIYPEDRIPPELKPLLWINPMASIIPCWRKLVLQGQFDWHMLGVGTISGAVLLLIGYGIYRKLEWRFAESI